ncbi:cytochrome-c peroxidase [Aquicoccus sp. G2-2]|uniref:cytochrome-c peroxidase n=1 Tax=Aquicoccus sp. G2-2 TaxID=3092120 RepID=UPI002ADF8572|nr:cytochrome c peroxidase [Aquicoccus sp. G2-2]MEA1113074.1 cytochrome c peroxidase [Aquicoccus sp. G2-2]
MHKWVTVGILSLQANLSLAAELPQPVTHSKTSNAPFSTILLGRDLFYDPILSGNRNIACATCHHAALSSGDGVALAIGERGAGLGLARHGLATNPAHALVPRNAPALFNLGAPEFQSLFLDGRVARAPKARMDIAMPPGAALERPVQSVLAAQALIPLTSPEEMAGSPGENAIADLVAKGHIRGFHGVWQRITERVEAIPSYHRRFSAIIGPQEPLHITDIANAIAAFEAYEFRATDSPFDAYLKGRTAALTPPQRRGADLFYGKANCATCHSGPYLTDQKFHVIGIPQIGPGKGHGAPFSDHGRAAVTGNPADLYRFRTPSLRNVALTAPYGHSGAYATLEAVVRHHLHPRQALLAYDAAQSAVSALDSQSRLTPSRPDAQETARIAAAIELTPVDLTEAEITDLLAFLASLTDPNAALGRLGPPTHVPSGLAIDKLSLN